MSERIYSNGKLLITGEYLVLDGAKAFALPTIYGQDLCISETTIPGIQWKSFDFKNEIWFETQLTYAEIISGGIKGNREIRNMLITILHGAYLQNATFVNDSRNLLIETHLDFDRSWGLGTSSTLINNIAQWTQTDAFKLLKTTFGGSGYDIAAAKAKSAIIYQITNGQPTFREVIFDAAFRKNLYFIHLNRKQDSNETIKTYKSKKVVSTQIISVINNLTDQICTTHDFQQFCSLLQQHESIISEVLEVSTIKEQMFPDFDGTIKSLGGWGGDFILVAAIKNPSEYFKAKGYETIIPYQEMILE